jgi:hypothetical protein
VIDRMLAEARTRMTRYTPPEGRANDGILGVDAGDLDEPA